MVPAVYSRTAMLVASAAAAAVALVLMTNTINPCGAAVLLKTNVTYDRYCAAADQNYCLIAQDLELELEFFMDSHVSRFLGTAPIQETKGTQIPNQQVIPCSTGEPYAQCHGEPNPKPKHCGNYDRNNPC